LAETLPDYMVPDVFCFVPVLPRGTSGKIDEHRLPPPPEEAGRTPPPETPLQRALAQLMREVLGIADVAGDIGIGDAFFALGGPSLLATQLLGRINRHLGITVALKAFYREPTIEALERFFAERAIASAA